jgi:uncharacterized protein YdhG (YjbR/CyaY superfamily)
VRDSAKLARENRRTYTRQTDGRMTLMKRNSTNPNRPKDITEYLSRIPRGDRGLLQKLRRDIMSAAPMAEEGISYGIPYFNYHGALVFFAAYKDHCSFFAAGKAILKRFSSDLSRYNVAASTIHFTRDNPLSTALVKKIVRARVKENETRFKAKQK